MTLFVVAGLVLLAVLIVRRFVSRPRETYKRGVLIDLPRLPLRSTARRKSTLASLTVGGVKLSTWDETKHFKMVGATGSGKSTAIRELLDGALARGDRAIFADPDGGYRERFFDRYRGDIVLNPFERDSVAWDPFAEINAAYDVEALSAGLIPLGEDPASNEWRAYARTFLTAVIRACHARDERRCTELWRLLAIAGGDELRPLVANTPAQAFLEADNSRMFGSIRAVTMSAIAALQYIQAQRAAPFSVRNWVKRKTAGGVLFIPYQAGQIEALRSMIAAWMRLAIFQAMSSPEDQDQRLWFVIDELDALGAIEGLKDALARLRKFGGRCVLGFQSIAQVSGTYGDFAAQTIIENCSNTLILRCSGSESGGTAEFASNLIGQREVIRRQTASGRDRDAGFSLRGARRSTNISEQHVIETAVMPSQIEQLPDLCGYFKSASLPAWQWVSLQRQERPT